MSDSHRHPVKNPRRLDSLTDPRVLFVTDKRFDGLQFSWSLSTSSPDRTGPHPCLGHQPVEGLDPRGRTETEESKDVLDLVADLRLHDAKSHTLHHDLVTGRKASQMDGIQWLVRMVLAWMVADDIPTPETFPAPAPPSESVHIRDSRPTAFH